MEQLGILDIEDMNGNNLKNRFSFKFSIINQKRRNTLDHHSSNHTMTIQRSKYLIIEDDIKRLQNQFTIQD